MAKHLFLFYLFLLEMVLGSAASIAPEAYWKLKLPYTPMPQSILNSLAPAPVEQPGRAEEFQRVQSIAKETLVSMKSYDGYLSYFKQGLDSTTPKYLSYQNQDSVTTNSYGALLSYDRKSLHSENPKYLSYNDNKQGLVSTNQYGSLLSYDNKKGLDSNDRKQGLVSTNGYDGLLSYDHKIGLDSNDQKYLSDNKQGLDTTGYDGLLSYKYNRKRLDSNNNQKDKVQPNQAGYGGLLSYNSHSNRAKETSHVDDEEEEDKSVTKDTVFFVEKDLQLGTKKTLHFKKSASKVMFLPRQVSNQIPFQSDKIQETLKILSLDPKSKEADILSKRIELCEEPTIEGVEKKCVTSLESMVDYVISMLGTNVRAITSQVEKDSEMEYTFKGVKKLAKDDHETVVCHKLGYPYAVFFCHRTTTIRSYLVNLVGKDGSKIEALAACHKESNDFLDKYAKNVLHVVPGSTRICHFPPAADTIMWVPKN